MRRFQKSVTIKIIIKLFFFSLLIDKCSQKWLHYDTELNPFTTEKNIDDNIVALIEYRNNVRGF